MIIVAFIIGVIVGFMFLAIVATGNHEDMLSTIRETAINDDPVYCKKYLKINRK